MPLGIEVGLGPGHIVLDGDPAPLKGAQPLQFSAHVYYGQTAGWIKMPLGTEVDLGPGHIMLDGDPALPQKGHSSPPLFSPCLMWPNSRPFQLLSTCATSLKLQNCQNRDILPTISGPFIETPPNFHGCQPYASYGIPPSVPNYGPLLRNWEYCKWVGVFQNDVTLNSCNLKRRLQIEKLKQTCLTTSLSKHNCQASYMLAL